MNPTAKHPTVEPIPPPDPARVLRTALLGLALCGAAALVGTGTLLSGSDGPGLLSSLRLILCAVGIIVAGSALSRCGSSWRLWLVAAGALLLASLIGLPPHWDSAKMLAGVLATVALIGAALAALPLPYRVAVGSVLVLFHFGGILTATTVPEPGPWLSSQAFNRVYTHYLSFLYMRNAYHFYSPEPGPASLMAVLVKYETTDPATGATGVVHEWLHLPRRDLHMKDPLGLSYYRRLSLTEMTTQYYSAMNTPQSHEKEEATRLRQNAALGIAGKEPIPLAPPEVLSVFNQYRIPYSHISRYVLPSYARHLAVELSGKDRRVVSTKIYRIEHRVLGTHEFAKNGSPFDPVSYLPFYMGEFDPSGKLVDPQDPMLYWLVPVVRKPGGAAPTDKDQKHYDDYLSKHAGFEVDWRRR